MAECAEPDHDAEFEEMVRQAFDLIRSGNFAQARTVIERLEAIDPHSPHGHHARIHFHLEEGSYDEGTARGTAYLTSHDPMVGINVHNAMHLTDMLLDLARSEEACEWLDRVVVPVVPHVPMQFPGASLQLWRTEVYGYGRDAGRTLPWQTLIQPGVTSRSSPTDPVSPFDVVAHMIPLIATGNSDMCDQRRRELAQVPSAIASTADIHASEATADVAHDDVVSTIIEGLKAWWAGDMPSVCTILGTHATDFAALSAYPDQLYAIEDTLITAELRTGHHVHSEQFLRKRIAKMPIARPRDLSWLAQIEHTEAAERGSD